MKKEKEVECNGTDLDKARVIQNVDEEEFKYLRILRKETVCHQKAKENVKKECLKRVKSIPKPKINTKDTFQAINTWTVLTICYRSVIIQWKKKELEHLDRNKKGNRLNCMEDYTQDQIFKGSIFSEIKDLLIVKDFVYHRNRRIARYSIKDTKQLVRNAAEEFNIAGYVD